MHCCYSFVSVAVIGVIVIVAAGCYFFCLLLLTSLMLVVAVVVAVVVVAVQAAEHLSSRGGRKLAQQNHAVHDISLFSRDRPWVSGTTRCMF